MSWRRSVTSPKLSLRISVTTSHVKLTYFALFGHVSDVTDHQRLHKTSILLTAFVGKFSRVRPTREPVDQEQTGEEKSKRLAKTELARKELSRDSSYRITTFSASFRASSVSTEENGAGAWPNTFVCMWNELKSGLVDSNFKLIIQLGYVTQWTNGQFTWKMEVN